MKAHPQSGKVTGTATDSLYYIDSSLIVSNASSSMWMHTYTIVQCSYLYTVKHDQINKTHFRRRKRRVSLRCWLACDRRCAQRCWLTSGLLECNSNRSDEDCFALILAMSFFSQRFDAIRDRSGIRTIVQICKTLWRILNGIRELSSIWFLKSNLDNSNFHNLYLE